MFGHICGRNGGEFVGRLAHLWAYANSVTLEISRPRKPRDNAFSESFNQSLLDEFTNVHWFDVSDAGKNCKHGGVSTRRTGHIGLSMIPRPS